MSNQTQTFDTKQTSLLAYQNFTAEKKQKDHDAICGALVVNSDLTYRQIDKDLRWNDHVKVARRMSELVLAGKVEISGRKICPIAKSTCSMYKLKE